MKQNDTIAALEDLKNRCPKYTKEYQALDYALLSLKTDETYQHMCEDIHAKWIWNNARFMYVCSNCGHNPTHGTGCSHCLDTLKEHYRYCRYCGAKMNGGTNGETD